MKTKAFAISIGIIPAILIAMIFSNPALTAAGSEQNQALTRQEIEQNILDSTVRLLMYSPLMWVDGFGMKILSSMGYGTVKDGRYLVTHNHYDADLFEILLAGDPEDLITIEILNANGEILDQVSGHQISIVYVENETVIFDFGALDGQGQFTSLGLHSSDFLPLSELELSPGMEVAQVDWDGSSAHIDWAPVKEITKKDGTMVVTVSNYVEKGASGGGVFYQGSHVGNNWSRLVADGGQEAHTTVALNSVQVAP